MTASRSSRACAAIMRTFTASSSRTPCAAFAVVLSERYITDRFLPDKAIDLIDEACSDVNLKNADLIRADEVEKEIGDYARERELLASAPPKSGDAYDDQELEHRYARIAELRSREMQLQTELDARARQGPPGAYGG